MTDLPSGDTQKVSRSSQVISLLLWSPYLCAWTWIALENDFPLLQLALTFFLPVCSYLVAHKLSGDWLMVVSILIGLLSELQGLHQSSTPERAISQNAWAVISAVHGLFGGILAKAKDLEEERYSSSHTITERLYIVVPFAIGQWTGYVLLNGWWGLLTAFSSMFTCLATVGYAMCGYRIMRYFGVFDGDLIGLVSKVFTTPFGVVFTTMFFFFFFAMYLAVPFFQLLMSLHAIVTSIGIILEVVVYEIA